MILILRLLQMKNILINGREMKKVVYIPCLFNEICLCLGVTNCAKNLKLFKAKKLKYCTFKYGFNQQKNCALQIELNISLAVIMT